MMTSNPHGGHGGQAPSPCPPSIDLTQTDSEMDECESEEFIAAMETESTDIPHDASPNEKRAHKFKEDGNKFFNLKQYENAIANCSKAIDLNHRYYGNRSKCYLLVREYNDELEDAWRSVQINPKFEKGYQRIFRSSLRLGCIPICDAVVHLVNVLPSDVKVDITGEMGNLQCLKTTLAQVKICKENNDYERALICINVAMIVASADLTLTAGKSDILYRLDKYQEAEKLAAEILEKNSDQVEAQVEAIFVCGRCEYQREELDKSQMTLSRALQLPSTYDCTQVLKFYENVKKLEELHKTGNEHFARENMSTAKKLYTEAVKILEETEMKNDLYHSKFCYNLSRIAFHEESKDEALTLCSKAIQLNPAYVEAYEIRADFYSQRELFKHSAMDYYKLTQLEPANRTWQNKLAYANFDVMKANRKDYYKILDVGRKASEKEIVKAYKKLALEYHPDRHSCSSDSVKEKNEQQFKEVAEAYAILTDPTSRTTHDHLEDFIAEFE